MQKHSILLLGPHTDDVELGAGGSVVKWIEEGKILKYVAFSATDERRKLIKEMNEATRVLGIDKKDIKVFNYPVREFKKHRQSILNDMIAINKEFEPALVIIPSTYSTHQDHEVIREEAFRAFKNVSIIGYEDPWNNLTFPTQMFSKLTRADLDTKIEALSCYKSQKNKDYMRKEFTESLARVRGVTIQTEYAECFEVVRWIN